jgi:hypothetical protein
VVTFDDRLLKYLLNYLITFLAGFTNGAFDNALVGEAAVCVESLLSEQRLPRAQRPAKNSHSKLKIKNSKLKTLWLFFFIILLDFN